MISDFFGVIFDTPPPISDFPPILKAFLYRDSPIFENLPPLPKIGYHLWMAPNTDFETEIRKLLAKIYGFFNGYNRILFLEFVRYLPLAHSWVRKTPQCLLMHLIFCIDCIQLITIVQFNSNDFYCPPDLRVSIVGRFA